MIVAKVMGFASAHPSYDYWSFAGLFEGEFSGTTDSYAGKGSIRRAW